MTDSVMLAELNHCGRERFVEALGGIFEHSPWVAERAFGRRPFTDIEALHDAMVAVVAAASRDVKLGLLRAHPELAGREARDGDLTAASIREQAGAGLTALDATEMERVAQLNADYRARFGFPFIIAVGRQTRQSIFAAWQRRLNADADDEFATALDEVYAIARLRLDALLDDTNRAPD